jgi:hypothetical protein
VVIKPVSWRPDAVQWGLGTPSRRANRLFATDFTDAHGLAGRPTGEQGRARAVVIKPVFWRPDAVQWGLGTPSRRAKRLFATDFTDAHGSAGRPTGEQGRARAVVIKPVSWRPDAVQWGLGTPSRRAKRLFATDFTDAHGSAGRPTGEQGRARAVVIKPVFWRPDAVQWGLGTPSRRAKRLFATDFTDAHGSAGRPTGEQGRARAVVIKPVSWRPDAVQWGLGTPSRRAKRLFATDFTDAHGSAGRPTGEQGRARAVW